MYLLNVVYNKPGACYSLINELFLKCTFIGALCLLYTELNVTASLE